MGRYKYLNNNQSILVLSFDIDGSCIEEFNLKNITGVQSAGDYGPKVGLLYILDLLDKLNCKATFHTPGRTAERFPARIKEVHDRGHEVAAHGFWHSNLSKLSEKDEWEEHSKAHKILTDITGVPLKGFRSTGGPMTLRTLDMIQELGYYYDSSSFKDYYPSKAKIEDKEYEMAEIPFSWIGDDFPYFWGGAMPSEFGGGGFVPLSSFNDALACWKDEFDHIHSIGGLYCLVNHPRCIGRPARLRVLEKFVRHAKGTPGVWFATESEVADWVLKGGLDE